MNEILGTSIYVPPVFRCQAPDSGNSEILALAGSAEQKERWLEPVLAGELRSAFSMTEPATPGSDPTQPATRAIPDGTATCSMGISGSRRTGRSPTLHRHGAHA
jgi:acyl-CoA dehydrogenase